MSDTVDTLTTVEITTTDIKRRVNKAKWTIIRNLLKILTGFGTPFGGVVRDWVLRKNSVDLYYAHCKAMGINADTYYENPDVHPESFKGRRLLPNDIDIFITEENYVKLMKTLKYHFTLRKSSSCPNYFFKSCELFNAALTHEKWILDLFSFPYNSVRTILFGKSIHKHFCEISIDFIIIGTSYLEHLEYIDRGMLYPPFCNPDFDVNLLSFALCDDDYDLQIVPLPYLKKMYTSQSAADNLADNVIANIINKRAFPVFPIKELYYKVFCECKNIEINPIRINKIVVKGFEVDFYNTILPPGVSSFWEKDYTETGADTSCAVCKELFTFENRAFNVCGHRKIHLMCFQNLLDKANPRDDSIVCTDCTETPFSNPCQATTLLSRTSRDAFSNPCRAELVSFLLKISSSIDNKYEFCCKVCNVCKVLYFKCRCTKQTCSLCKKEKQYLPLEPVLEDESSILPEESALED